MAPAASEALRRWTRLSSRDESNYEALADLLTLLSITLIVAASVYGLQPVQTRVNSQTMSAGGPAAPIPIDTAIIAIEHSTIGISVGGGEIKHYDGKQRSPTKIVRANIRELREATRVVVLVGLHAEAGLLMQLLSSLSASGLKTYHISWDGHPS